MVTVTCGLSVDTQPSISGRHTEESFVTRLGRRVNHLIGRDWWTVIIVATVTRVIERIMVDLLVTHGQTA